MSESTQITTYKGIGTAEGLDLLTSEPIAVSVGNGCATKTWYLPEKLLVNAAPVFATALNGSFSETTSRKITLPEDSPYDFGLFVRWLYVGRISGDIFSCEDEALKNDVLGTLGSTSDDDADLAVAQMYLQACSLEDKLDCLIYRDCAVLELIKLYNTVAIEAETIRYVFGHFARGSKIRLLAVDQFRFDLQNGEFLGREVSFVSAARSAMDFGLDFLEANLEDNGNAINPHDQKERYMEVLTDTDGN